MKTIQTITADYDTGRLTKHDAAWEILCALTDDNINDLGGLSSELATELRSVIDALETGRRSTTGSRPAEHQIKIGRAWSSSN